MISVDKALDEVLNNLHRPKTEKVHVDDSNKRILAEDIYADQDFPPFNRVMMDGVAVNLEVFHQGKKSFAIEGMQTAGAPQMTLSDKQNCIEVMTGAMLPLNADAVVRYEDVTVENNIATIQLEHIEALQNVHLKGTDRVAGDLLIKKNTKISPAEVAVLATVGKAEVEVYQQLKVAIVSTGDELVSVDTTPNPYQIRQSNAHALKAALYNYGLKADNFHIHDEAEVLTNELKGILSQYDVVLMSGGVSRGKKDYVPQALEDLGVEKKFHKVKQKPGKPFWFGSNAEATVFALPGNPVSTFLCFYKYVVPWIHACYGLNYELPSAAISQDFDFKPGLTNYLQVKISRTVDGKVIATPVAGRGSGDLANLLDADAFLELPEGQSHYKEGDILKRIDFR